MADKFMMEQSKVAAWFRLRGILDGVEACPISYLDKSALHDLGVQVEAVLPENVEKDFAFFQPNEAVPPRPIDDNLARYNPDWCNGSNAPIDLARLLKPYLEQPAEDAEMGLLYDLRWSYFQYVNARPYPSTAAYRR